MPDNSLAVGTRILIAPTYSRHKAWSAGSFPSIQIASADRGKGSCRTPAASRGANTDPQDFRRHVSEHLKDYFVIIYDFPAARRRLAPIRLHIAD